MWVVESAVAKRYVPFFVTVVTVVPSHVPSRRGWRGLSGLNDSIRGQCGLCG